MLFIIFLVYSHTFTHTHTNARARERVREPSVSRIYQIVLFLLCLPVPFSEATILGMTKDALITLAAIAGVSINRDDFVNKWHARFGDSPDFARATFNAYDTNKDGKLTVYEIEAIYNQVLNREGTDKL